MRKKKSETASSVYLQIMKKLQFAIPKNGKHKYVASSRGPGLGQMANGKCLHKLSSPRPLITFLQWQSA